nr:hypothetical protein [Tanacetum cinerariifolium]
MEEYIRLQEEKSRRRGKVYNWETATNGKIWDNEDIHDLGYVETEFPAIVFNDVLISKVTLSCEPTTVDTAYSLNEYSVFDTVINTAYPGDGVPPKYKNDMDLRDK